MCFLCVLKVAWHGLTVSVSSCCVSSFWCRIVETDLSLTAFVAGNTRCNLKSIVISEKNSLSTSEHCVMLLIIPGSFFIWFDKLNCVFLSCPCHVRVSEFLIMSMSRTRFTLSSCLDVKELLARSRHEI